jgi:hypothetical protein
MACDAANHRVCLGCRSRVMVVVDSTTGKVVASLPIGDKADASVFDAFRKVAFTSTGDGYVYGFRR